MRSHINERIDGIEINLFRAFQDAVDWHAIPEDSIKIISQDISDIVMYLLEEIETIKRRGTVRGFPERIL